MFGLGSKVNRLLSAVRESYPVRTGNYLPSSRGRPQGYRNGFTLVEVLVTMVIAAIIMGFAIPILKTPHTVAEANSLLGSLQLARSAAVKQGQTVIVCASANPNAAQPTCSNSTAWNTGWIVVVPAAGVATPCLGAVAGDAILQVQSAFSGSDTAAFTGTSAYFCFNRSGFSPVAYNGVVQIDTSPVNTALRRCVIVSGVGHVQVVPSGGKDVNNVACP